MSRRLIYTLSAALALFSFPCLLQAADVMEQESVQEPDADDMSAEDTMKQEPPSGEKPATEAEGANPPAPKPQPTGDAHYDTVLLQGLNKVTARAQPIEATIGSVVRYGTIEIVAHKCWKSSPEERPENAALLEVSEIKQGEKPQRIFSGWMFSSSPAISSLEHPFYDITVVSCEKTALKQ